jgi:acyl-coenzyme A thioesterase PaaI-like protein
MSAAGRIAGWWRRLGGSVAGRVTFARLLRVAIPYTGTVRPHVLELRPGYARVSMRDRRRVRNHLGSVHAVALTNLGELASGLALVPWLDGARGIVVALTTTYERKARGPLVAEASCTIPVVTGPVEHETSAYIRDRDGAVVAVVTARWRLAPTGERG